MADKTHYYAPVLGKRIRVTPLDACGRVDKTRKAIVTSGFVTISLSTETEDGTEITVKRADGSVCISEKQADTFKYFTAEIEFCGVNPSLLALVSNAKEYKDEAGDIAGFTYSEGKIDKKFALEIWTGLAGQACAEGADEASGYLLLPYVNAGVPGDISIDGENAVSFPMQGAVTKSGNGWGKGPWDVVKTSAGQAAKLPTALDPKDHLLMMDTALKVPDASEQPIAVPQG